MAIQLAKEIEKAKPKSSSAPEVDQPQSNDFSNLPGMEDAPKDTDELLIWYLGLQAIAPRTSAYKTKGALLWEMMILKINWYGLKACTNPNVVRIRG